MARKETKINGAIEIQFSQILTSRTISFSSNYKQAAKCQHEFTTTLQMQKKISKETPQKDHKEPKNYSSFNQLDLN